MPPRWPFADPGSLAVITLKRIVYEGAPVLLVTHDADGTWQFLDADEANERDAAVAALDEMVALDPTLRELAALPRGYYAVRQRPEDPWEVGYSGED